jgi:catechol 2,3-dioxygenase-like lactoylglutathione lyase family enzyme
MIDRRSFLLLISTLTAARRMFGQAPRSSIRLREYNHVTLKVSDPKRSMNFYQGLFGLTALNRDDGGGRLQIGAGPQYLGLSASDRSGSARMDHFSFGVENFDHEQILEALTTHGLKNTATPGPMTMTVAADVPEISIQDGDGVRFQLVDANFRRSQSSDSSSRGVLPARRLSHLTLFSPNPSLSTAFYRDVFGAGIRSYQGPIAPAIAIGPGVEFLMFTGATQVNHFCVTVDQFGPERVVRALESYGIKPRANNDGPTVPMRHYISLRGENRGGAKDGTPELYFTDPDGIRVQIQDVSYCGGAGFLGNLCPQP